MKMPEVDPAEKLQHVATRLIRIARSSHKEHSISSAQYSLMALLNDEPGKSVVWLAQRENVSHPTISRIVAGLIKKGLVARDPDPNDKRSGLLRLTPAGLKLYREVAERRVRLFQMILSQLQPETVADILVVAERISKPLETAFQSE